MRATHFTVSLANPITINGRIVVPKRADASGQVTDAHAGKLKGAATLNLALTSITIQGKRHTVQRYLVGQQLKGER